MSQNLWADFDKKISELSTKADELDGLRVRLEQLPQRLVVIKQQTEVLLRTAKGTMSDSLKKEIAKKVEALDKIFKKLEGTKNLSDPLLQKLEGELQKLEDFTKSSAVKIDERAQKQTGNTLDAMGDNASLADSALFQEKPVDVIPPPVEKLLDLGPPTKSVWVKDPDPPAGTNNLVNPGPPKLNPNAKPYEPPNANDKKPKNANGKKPPPPKGNKYTALTGSSANSGVPKNIQGNTRSARENGGRASFSQGEGEGKPAWDLSTKPTIKLGGFLSSKKYSHKRRNRKLKSQKRAKLMKRKSKAHKKKASTRRR